MSTPGRWQKMVWLAGVSHACVILRLLSSTFAMIRDTALTQPSGYCWRCPGVVLDVPNLCVPVALPG